MTESMDNLVLEQLRLIRNEIVDFRTESRERFGRIELRLAVIEQRLSAIEVRLADAETGHQRRLERIEQRLDLTDPNTH